MTASWWVLPLIACIALPIFVGIAYKTSKDGLPRDFDFDHYKNRELNLRGLFDKTRWK